MLGAPLIEGLFRDLQLVTDLLGRHPLIYDAAIVVRYSSPQCPGYQLGAVSEGFLGNDGGGRLSFVQAA